jgi:thiamine transporter ThiT
MIQNTELDLSIIFIRAVSTVETNNRTLWKFFSCFMWWGAVALKTVLINISDKMNVKTFSKMCVIKLILVSVVMKINKFYMQTSLSPTNCAKSKNRAICWC